MTMPSLQKIWPEWEIEKQIGQGTYGVVYQAVRQENDLTSRAAVKVISIPQDPRELDALRSDGLDLQSSRAYLKRIVDEFVSEIRLMETFKGIQNIVSIEDYKVVEKQDALGWDIYIRMELLTPFNVYVCDRTLSESDIIRLGRDICTALEICGRRNIIHRDIKPENIFVNSFGSFKLGDFGTARNMESLTGGLSQRGTFNYMAPEVVTGASYDATVDVYSLGLVLYRLLNNNRLPFLSEKQLLSPSERRIALDRRIQGEALPAPREASTTLAQVILKACAFRPQDRYASAGEMRRALEAVEVEGQSASAPAVQEAPAVREPSAAEESSARQNNPKKEGKVRRLILWSIAAGTTLGLLLAGLFFLLRRNPPVSMEIWSSPVKREYRWGETLDTSGLQALITYEDGTWKILDKGLRCSPDVLKTTGTQEITVGYRGLTETFCVDVIPHPSALRIASEPNKTLYRPGEELETDGLVLELIYDDGTVRNVTSKYTCYPSSFSELGTTQVTVLYQDFRAVFSVSVQELVGIQIASPPEKTEYEVGQKLQTKGLVVEGVFEGGATAPIDGYTCIPSAFGRTSLQSVDVKYEDFTASFPVSVYKPSGITILTPPDKTKYQAGETLNTQGLTFEITYTNGDRKVFDSRNETYYCEVLDGNRFTQDRLASSGEKTVYVDYKGLRDSFIVTVTGSADAVAAAAPQAQPTEASAPQTDISFENMDVRLTGWGSDVTLDGYNQKGEPVWWCLNIKFAFPEQLRNRVSAYVTCSWDHIVNGSPEWERTATWQDAKEGMTYVERASYAGSSDTFAYMVFLPDDPDIAGPQSVTVKIGDVEKTISFTLTYLGDYDTGLGWAIDDVSF